MMNYRNNSIVRKMSLLIGILLLAVNAQAQIVIQPRPISAGGVIPNPIYPASICLDNTNQDTCLFREGADWLFQRRSTNAQRASWANTYASATNYEAFSIDWQTTTNFAYVGTRTAATGNSRGARLVSQADSAASDYAMLQMTRGSVPFVQLGLLSAALSNISTTATGNWFNLGIGTSTATTGTIGFVTITPTYNQASGNAANTDLLINRTQTAVGSGAQLLIDAQVGTISKFKVDNTGKITTTGQIVSDTIMSSGNINATGIIQPTASREGIVTSANGLMSIVNDAQTIGIQFNGGTAAPTVTSCGTGTVTAGSRNTVGEITATGATACTITFGAPAWTNTPFCTITEENAVVTTPYVSAKSTTAITVSGLTANDVFVYHCIGRF